MQRASRMLQKQKAKTFQDETYELGRVAEKESGTLRQPDPTC